MLGGWVKLMASEAMSLPFPAASLSWEQEYRRLVTLEGLQAAVERHLLRLQELREGEAPW